MNDSLIAGHLVDLNTIRLIVGWFRAACVFIGLFIYTLILSIDIKDTTVKQHAADDIPL